MKSYRLVPTHLLDDPQVASFLNKVNHNIFASLRLTPNLSVDTTPAPPKNDVTEIPPDVQPTVAIPTTAVVRREIDDIPSTSGTQQQRAAARSKFFETLAASKHQPPKIFDTIASLNVEFDKQLSASKNQPAVRPKTSKNQPTAAVQKRTIGSQIETEKREQQTQTLPLPPILDQDRNNILHYLPARYHARADVLLPILTNYIASNTELGQIMILQLLTFALYETESTGPENWMLTYLEKIRNELQDKSILADSKREFFTLQGIKRAAEGLRPLVLRRLSDRVLRFDRKFQ